MYQECTRELATPWPSWSRC